MKIDPFDIVEKYRSHSTPKTEPTPKDADITEGQIIAVLIDSPIVGPVWFALDDGFQSEDEIPVFYAHELPFLKGKTPEQLREIHKVKLAFGPGSIVKQ